MTFHGYVRKKLSELDEQGRIDFLLQALPYIEEHETPGADVEVADSGVSTLIDSVHVRHDRHLLARLKSQMKDDDVTDRALLRCRASESELWRCEHCGGWDTVVTTTTCERTCRGCGVVVRHDGDVPPGPDDYTRITVTSTFCYKRLNHLYEHVSTLQARENTNIPDSVVEEVRREFVKARLKDPKYVTRQRVRQYLKKLGYSKLYEHTWHIVSLLGGETVKVDPDVEAKLKQMFQMVQAPFQKFKPPKRKNFLSYNYVLYKFCELLGEDQLLPHFPLLKNRDKLRQADQTWKHITRELDWQFIPTL